MFIVLKAGVINNIRHNQKLPISTIKVTKLF